MINKYTMMLKAVELHYPIIQFLIIPVFFYAYKLISGFVCTIIVTCNVHTIITKQRMNW